MWQLNYPRGGRCGAAASAAEQKATKSIPGVHWGPEPTCSPVSLGLALSRFLAGVCGAENKDQHRQRPEGSPVEAESLAQVGEAARGKAGRPPPLPQAHRTHASPSSLTPDTAGLSSAAEWEANGAV